MSKISIFYPCSKDHHAIKDFFRLNAKSQVITSLVTTIVTLLTLPIFGLLGVVVFRCLVKKFSVVNLSKNKLDYLEAQTLEKVEDQAKEHFPQNIVPQESNVSDVPSKMRTFVIPLVSKPKILPLPTQINFQQPDQDSNPETLLLQETTSVHFEKQESILTEQNPNLADEKENFPFHDAVMAGNLEQFEALIDVTEDKNIKNKEGLTPLHIAASLDDATQKDIQEELVNSLIEAGADTSIPDQNGNLPLHHACLKGNWPIIEILLEETLDINTKNNDGMTPLNILAKTGKEECLRRLLKYNSDPSLADDEGNLPLHWAAKEGFLGIVEKLIKFYENKSIKNNQQKSALELAKESNHLGVVEFLEELEEIHSKSEIQKSLPVSSIETQSVSVQSLEENKQLIFAIKNFDMKKIQELVAQKVDVNIEDVNGDLPLHHAVREGFFRCVDILVHLTNDINKKNHEGMTPLHLAAKAYDDSDWYEDQIAILNCLLNQKADPNIPDKFNHLPLHYAILHAYRKFVKILAPITQLDFQNEKSFLYLSFERYRQDRSEFNLTSMIKYLLKNGADIKKAASDGSCFIHWVFECEFPKDYGMEELIDSYLDSEDLLVTDSEGETALHYAIRNQKQEWMLYLIEKENLLVDMANHSGYFPLHYAILYADQEMANALLLESCNSINVRTESQDTPLHLAAGMGEEVDFDDHQEILEWLLENGANANLSNEDGELPLHIAARHGYPAIFEPILEQTTDINAKNGKGKTALHILNNENSVQILLDKGANADIQDDEGNLPIHIYAKWPRNTLIETILSKTTDINSKNHAGKTATQIAQESGWSFLVDFLLSRGGKLE